MEPVDNAPAAISSFARHVDGQNGGLQPDPGHDPESDSGSATFARIFIGPHGLRAGWSILLAACLFYVLRLIVGTVFVTVNLVDNYSGQTASSTIFLELIPFLSMLGTGAIVARIENRSFFSYNLAGAHRLPGFFLGAASGFLALSALIGVLGMGGWMHFHPVTIPGLSVLRFAALWGLAFLLVGCVEEGIFRCYLLSTLTRGLNFWWALAGVGGLCAWLWLNGSAGQSGWGVYLIAALGLIPCLILHQRAATRSAFWQAAWVTSTAFGLIHTFNHGENLIGIFAAATIGFTWCVSIRLTGSACWAIGCHAAWDWGETFFYGTADSGLPPNGHLFSTTPAGNPLLSGGADGPEGSVLILGAIGLLLVLIYAAPLLLRRGEIVTADR